MKDAIETNAATLSVGVRALSALIESELHPDIMFEHNLFGKPVYTFRGHVLGGIGMLTLLENCKCVRD